LDLTPIQKRNPNPKRRSRFAPTYACRPTGRSTDHVPQSTNRSIGTNWDFCLTVGDCSVDRLLATVNRAVDQAVLCTSCTSVDWSFDRALSPGLLRATLSLLLAS